MQFVEYVVECVLCTWFTGKLLHVIKNQHINALVEIDEIINLVVSYGSGVLAFKHPGRHIENSCARIRLFYLDSNGLNQVCFAHTSRAKKKQRIKHLAVWVIGGNGLANAHGKFVTVAAAIILKCVFRVELRVYIIKRWSGKRIARSLRLFDIRSQSAVIWLHGSDVCIRNFIRIKQLFKPSTSKVLSYCRVNNWYIFAFKLFYKIRRRQTQSKLPIFKL